MKQLPSYLLKLKFFHYIRLLFILSLIIYISWAVNGQISKEILCKSWLVSEYSQFAAEFPCDTSTLGGDPIGPTIQTGTYQGIEYIHIRKVMFFPPPFFTFYYKSRYYDLAGNYLGDGTLDSQGNGFLGDDEENEAILYSCKESYPSCCKMETIEMVQGVECILPMVISTGEILYPCEYTNGTAALPEEVGYKTNITYTPYTGNQCFSICQQGARVAVGCMVKQDSCSTAVEMVKAVECVLPMVISTGEILYPCEYTNGVAALPQEVGYRTNISYSPYTGNQCFSFCLQGTSVSIGCVQFADTCIFHPDYAPLMALYQATSGQNWYNNKGWVEGAGGINCNPCNGWYGVVCDSSRVTGLFLNNNNLTGSIPTELGEVSELKNFTADNNNISGTIPPEIGLLSKLENIAIFDCSLSGELPSSLDNLRNLKYISLNGNQLSGNLPDFLGNLSNLQNIYLFNNGFSGSIPSSLGNLTNLKNLWLQDNNLSGCLPENLSKLCETADLVLIEGNPLLSTQSWSNFCNNKAGICAPSFTQNEFNHNVCTLFPNPAKDRIMFKNVGSIEQVDFISVNKMEFVLKNTHSGFIDISALPPAIYLVRIKESNGEIHYLKFLKL